MKIASVSFDLFSSVMGITGLGLVWRAASSTYAAPEWLGEILLGTGLLIFIFLIFCQTLRLICCRDLLLEEWRSRSRRNFFCAATISGFLLCAALVPYSIKVASLFWIASICAQLFFLVCTFRRWVIDELEVHEIGPVWLIPMVGNASPSFAGLLLGFPGISKMMLFSAILCWALFMPLILWRIVFVRPNTPFTSMPGLAIMVSAPAVISVALTCLYGQMTEVALFMAWTALFFAIVLISLWRRMLPPFHRGWWGFTFPSTALASALIRVDSALPSPLNHMLALGAIIFASFIVTSVTAIAIIRLLSGPEKHRVI
ncbi:C4-dicarboxylate transporter [Pantoea agglomerans]|uniref:SLAC1 family transporter n=1 Tax=Enterobacter agglomerans TaxID=549 RepID=UPI001F5BDECC|nr:C4-dicarboxylate transporter [Pantoea agglomerans]